MKAIVTLRRLIHGCKIPPQIVGSAVTTPVWAKPPSLALRGLVSSCIAPLGLVVCVLFGTGIPPLYAYPPAPHHLLYGIVRDEMGNPLMLTNAEVIMETLAGADLRTTVIPNLYAGINYRLAVPMDAGLTADAYKPNALRPTVPFRLKVKIGQAVYLPIELSGNYASLGQPARRTRLDLTLGEDADGDGLPDAWERMLMAMLGGDLTLQDIGPNDDADGDGLTNLQEYLSGTYAFDPADGFRLDLVGRNGPNALLEFMVLRGHAYTVLGSTDLGNWVPLNFRLAGEPSDAPTRTSYQAADVQVLRVEALSPEGQSTSSLFFKAEVQ